VIPDSLLCDLVQFVHGVDLAQHDSHSRGSSTQHVDISRRNRPSTENSPIGSAPRYCRHERLVRVIRRVWPQLDGSEVAGVGRVRQAMHLGVPTHSRQCDDAVVKRCTTTQHHVPAIRVGVG
jgi:hypothetical protein